MTLLDLFEFNEYGWCREYRVWRDTIERIAPVLDPLLADQALLREHVDTDRAHSHCPLRTKVES